MVKIVLRGDLPPVKEKTAIEDLKHFQPGDFVDAVPDDHVFGKDETPPLFEIISVPDMTVEEARLLCAPPKDVVGADRVVRKFAPRSSFNLDWKATGKGLTKAQLLASVKQNALIDNPAVIGLPRSEIG